MSLNLKIIFDFLNSSYWLSYFKSYTAIFLIIGVAYFFAELRNKFAFIPLYLLTKLQGRNFKIANEIKEIEYALQLSDKGFGIEEMFAKQAWYPVLSIESTNGAKWKELRKNFFTFVHHLPSPKKLKIIAEQEANILLSKNINIDSSMISKTTLKIFLKWIFCENDKLNTETDNNIDIIENLDFEFIDNFMNDEDFLNKLYLSSLEYRKEIALKGKGDMKKKQELIHTFIDVLLKSKYKDILDWNRPECYSVLLQPFVISPMINISDIAVGIEINLKKSKERLEDLDVSKFINQALSIFTRFLFLNDMTPKRIHKYSLI